MAQIEKNTVSAQNQLSKFVHTEKSEKEDIKILFVGNSITLHGVKTDIGWNNHWGMAASARENDYVHIVIDGIMKRGLNASYCICQVAEWERRYKDGHSVLGLYERARDFDADIIIMRCVENCPWQDFDAAAFKKEYKRLIDYLNPNGTGTVILTTGFWKHPADDAISETGKENDYRLAYLGDLGERNDMKAVGLFEHDGVAQHPGDLGMKTIAERIMDILS